MEFHNYILLTCSIIVLGLLIVLAKRKSIKKTWLKRLINTIGIITIVVLVLAVVLFPDLPSVPTTGKYSYSSCTIQMTDESRIETYKDDGSFRKLSVLVYYPDNNLIQNNTCPLIVFSHGGISYKTSNISLFEELASHGYVVVSIDHTYHALNTEIDKKIVSINSEYMRELSTEDSHNDIENSYMLFQKWMQLRTTDVNYVIDTFVSRSLKESTPFNDLIDTENIGVVGHSLGGSAALGVARQNEYIKAVVSLEAPYMCDIIGIDGEEFLWNTKEYSCAIMNIYSDTGYPLIESDNKYVQNKNYLYNNENVEYYHIIGSNHYSLTDLARKSPLLCTLLGGRYKTSGYDTLKFINEKCVAFFDIYLKD